MTDLTIEMTDLTIEPSQGHRVERCAGCGELHERVNGWVYRNGDGYASYLASPVDDPMDRRVELGIEIYAWPDGSEDPVVELSGHVMARSGAVRRPAFEVVPSAQSVWRHSLDNSVEVDTGREEHVRQFLDVAAFVTGSDPVVAGWLARG
jgi:hypothetical protein